MKKILVTFVAVIMVSSFSAVVSATSPVVKLTKQMILSEESPAPEPAPAPAPAPEPEPK